MKYHVIILAAALIFGAGSVVHAEGTWTTVADLTADGSSKEVAVGKNISKITITCTANSVTIKSVEVVSGEQRYSFKVGNTLIKDQTQQITVGNSLTCETLNISDEGNGKYRVRVKD